MEKNTQQSAERQSDALAVLLSADELASYAEAQRVCEAFPNDTTSGTGILTCDLARLLIVIDRLAACKAFVEAWDKSHQLEKTDIALIAARAAISAAEGSAK